MAKTRNCGRCERPIYASTDRRRPSKSIIQGAAALAHCENPACPWCKRCVAEANRAYSEALEAEKERRRMRG